ncbi:MAG TPA: NAD(P)/FAD-dependent oxidoreductase [Microbacteriaceae bacterium]|nr:NAD(P)/FAD-dependent oxidoreductase [Microbacteriaceae bacterium]
MRVAVIGAGPSGLAVARALQKEGIKIQGFEASHGVGGLWDITNPRSTMYESAHLISSRTTTEFDEFPMRSTADYPSHEVLHKYFEEYADHFSLTELFQFKTQVTKLEPHPSGGWALETQTLTKTGKPKKDGKQTAAFDHVIMANGILAEPNIPAFKGNFTGEIMHTSLYKNGKQLEGKRTLIVGAGNSGCDIAVDAVHFAKEIDMSVRRGYYFVPRYIFGRPSDTLNQGKPLPRTIKQFLDKWMLRAFTGDPTRFGFPKPRYKIYESHPIINTMVLNHLGQGDLEIRADIERFEGKIVHFVDGSSKEYDLILLATGYKLDYPFVDRKHINWSCQAPTLYLNIFEPNFNGLYITGMVEASGLGWQGRYEQGELIAAYLGAVKNNPKKAKRFRDRVQYSRWPDLTAGYKYLGLDRMSFYVNKDVYRGIVTKETADLKKETEYEPR